MGVDAEASGRSVSLLTLIDVTKSFGGLVAIAVVLTVVGALFRGPGWRFVVPWTHLYLEL